ncbi:MAG: hypothetical protein WHT46_05510 [Candidatus Geothermincolales bacterium]
MEGLKSAGKREIFILLLSAAFSSFLLWQGCGGGGGAAIDQVDRLLGEVAERLERVWSTVDAWKGFDFEDASFTARIDASLHESRIAADELSGLLFELDRDYSGFLENLQPLISELISKCREGLKELVPALEELSALSKAIEPVMREEAVITQMEAPRSDQEWLERLRRLEGALKASLPALKNLSPGGSRFPGLKNALLEIFSLLDEMVRRLASSLPGRAGQRNISIEDKFDRMQDLIRGWDGLVDREFSGLSIFKLDPHLERVELEINELLLRRR